MKLQSTISAAWTHGRKRSAFLLLPALLLTVFACATSEPTGEPRSEVFDRANSVIIRTADTPEVALDRVIGILNRLEFDVQSSDTYLLRVQTGERTLSGSFGVLQRRIYIEIVEDEMTQIRIAGRFNLQDRRGNRVAANEEIIYSRYNTRIMTQMWQEMKSVADHYEQGEIFFVRM